MVYGYVCRAELKFAKLNIPNKRSNNNIDVVVLLIQEWIGIWRCDGADRASFNFALLYLREREKTKKKKRSGDINQSAIKPM